MRVGSVASTLPWQLCWLPNLYIHILSSGNKRTRLRRAKTIEIDGAVGATGNAFDEHTDREKSDVAQCCRRRPGYLQWMHLLCNEFVACVPNQRTKTMLQWCLWFCKKTSRQNAHNKMTTPSALLRQCHRVPAYYVPSKSRSLTV